MVVISIISLLISILLPALGAARKSAQAVACLNNLKQIGTAEAVYENNTKFYTMVRYQLGQSYWADRWEMQLQRIAFGKGLPSSWSEANHLVQKSAPFHCPNVQYQNNNWKSYGHNTFRRLVDSSGVGLLSPVKNWDGTTNRYAVSSQSMSPKFSNSKIIFISDTYSFISAYPNSYYELDNTVTQWDEIPPSGTTSEITGFRHPGETRHTLFLDLHAQPVGKDRNVNYYMVLDD